MNKKSGYFLKRLARASYFFGSLNLLVGLVLTVVHFPTGAASAETTESPGGEPVPLASPTMYPDCTPPDDWHLTTRMLRGRNPVKEWPFEVDEPEMDVTLEFFYYQDYDRYGCPHTEENCNTGACQKNEVGWGETPFGTFEVTDGILGPNRGTERQSGRLTQGSYIARFTVTGGGSMSIGLKVHRSSLPTDTPIPPTSTPTTVGRATFVPSATSTPTATPVPTNTPTLTATAGLFGSTQVATATVFQQLPTGTPTPTDTPTSTSEVLPPPGASTPTLAVSATPHDTLAPPRQPSGTPESGALIPQTGIRLPGSGVAGSAYPGIFFGLGITILGLGGVAHGMGRQLDR